MFIFLYKWKKINHKNIRIEIIHANFNMFYLYMMFLSQNYSRNYKILTGFFNIAEKPLKTAKTRSQIKIWYQSIQTDYDLIKWMKKLRVSICLIHITSTWANTQNKCLYIYKFPAFRKYPVNRLTLLRWILAFIL